MRKLKLSSGHDILLDDEDFDKVSSVKWHLSTMGYVIKRSGPSKKYTFIHRIIANTPVGMETDHIDGNKLNNQKSNLRVCDRKTNGRNLAKWSSKTSSKYKGVSFFKSKNKWRAYIVVNKKQKHLGYFNSEKDAASAYNENAKLMHMEYARRNVL